MILPPLVFPVKSVYQAQSLKNTISLEKFYFSQIADNIYYFLVCVNTSNGSLTFAKFSKLPSIRSSHCDYATLGSAKAHGREPKTCLGRVFNYISQAVLMMCMYSSTWMHDHIYSSKLGLGLVLLAKVCPWLHLLALGHLKRQVTNRNHPIRVVSPMVTKQEGKENNDRS